MLYTNGVEWRCLYINEYSEELIKRIIGMVNERIDSEKENPNKDFDWWEKFKDIEFKIVDECITKNCIENWDDFIIKYYFILATISLFYDVQNTTIQQIYLLHN